MKTLTLATAVVSACLWAPSVGIASETSRAIILAQMAGIDIGPDGVRVLVEIGVMVCATRTAIVIVIVCGVDIGNRTKTAIRGDSTKGDDWGSSEA